MVKRLLLFLFLFVSITSRAQVEADSAVSDRDSVIPDTFDFDLKNYKGTGELTFISQRSKTTGGVYQISLQTGDWQFYDNREVLRIQGAFKVKDGLSLKSGIWNYFDGEGELLMTRNESHASGSPVFYKPFVLIIPDGYEVINFNKDGTLGSTRIIVPKNTVNDEAERLVYDTLLAMDRRNPDTWLIPEKMATPVKEDLNFVPNPGFEKNDGRIRHRAEVRNHITNWKVSAGTPDYYRVKNLNTVEGYAMVGCRFYTEQFNDIEFISSELTEPLVSNRLYCFRIYLRLRETSIYGVNAFGLLLSSKIPSAEDLIFGTIKPSVKHNGGASLAFKTKWMELSCSYKAIGNEKFITLGSFANSDSMVKTKLKGELFEAYYYFDMVQLFEIENESQCKCSIGRNDAPEITATEKPDQGERDEPKTFVIRNIFFENDKWNLLPESFDALDSLYDVIDENNFRKIEISGHTSNTGSRERNLFLSKKRAEAVRKYLVNKGLSSSMFICKGFGPDRPIAGNDTEEGQAENRRVEFTILE